MQIAIENENYRISISSVGASITDVFDKRRDFELLHQTDDRGWSYQDIVCFPFIGIGEYKHQGKPIRNNKRHGFVQNKDFICKKIAPNSVLLAYISNAADLAFYPFKFVLKIVYTINGNDLLFRFNIENQSDETMYFQIGNQLGFRANTNTVIDLCNNNICYPLSSESVNLNKKIKLQKQITLNSDLFDQLDTIVLINKSGNVIVNTPRNILTYNINSPLIAIWTISNNPNFVCVSPWWGGPIYSNKPIELDKCPYINSIAKNTIADYYFSINIQAR